MFISEQYFALNINLSATIRLGTELTQNSRCLVSALDVFEVSRKKIIIKAQVLTIIQANPSIPELIKLVIQII